MGGFWKGVKSLVVSGIVGLKNVAGAQVNPATEDTLALIKTTDGVKKITDALPAGTNLIGKVGIDQTTPGTTNKVIAGIDQTTPGTTNKVVAGIDQATANANEIVVKTNVYPPNRASFLAGFVTAAAANTGYQLPSKAIPNGYAIVINAFSANTGVIRVGISAVNVTPPGGVAHYTLNAGDSIAFQLTNLNQIWYSAGVISEGLQYAVEI